MSVIRRLRDECTAWCKLPAFAAAAVAALIGLYRFVEPPAWFILVSTHLVVTIAVGLITRGQYAKKLAAANARVETVEAERDELVETTRRMAAQRYEEQRRSRETENEYVRSLNVVNQENTALRSEIDELRKENESLVSKLDAFKAKPDRALPRSLAVKPGLRDLYRLGASTPHSDVRRE